MAVEKARRKTVRASAWVALGTALVLGIATLGTTDAATNLVWNASFERTGSTWLTPWTFSVKSGAAATIRQDGSTKTVGLYSANVAVTSTNGSRWLVQLSQGGIALTSGQAYRLEFSARVGAPRSIEATFQQSGSPYATYTSRSFSVGTSWVRYSHAFTAPVTQSTSRSGSTSPVRRARSGSTRLRDCDGQHVGDGLTRLHPHPDADVDIDDSDSDARRRGQGHRVVPPS